MVWAGLSREWNSPEEPGGQVTEAGFFAGLGQGRVGQVDAGGVQVECGAHEDVLAGPAAEVEDPASEMAVVGECLEDWLRPADVPGRRGDG